MAKSIKESYERVLVLIALVLFAVALAFAVMKLITPGVNIEKETMAQKKDANSVELEAYQNKLLALAEKKSFGDELPLDVFTSEERVHCINSNGVMHLIRKDAMICPFDQLKQPDPCERDSDDDGMDDCYEEENGLDPLLNDAYADLDGDGFSNIEEHRAETSPNDEKDHPEYLSKLRIDKSKNKPVPFQFLGVQKTPNGGNFYSLKLGSPRTYFAEMNETIDKWTIIKYTEIKGTTPGARDKSELEITNGAETVTLVLGKRGGIDFWIGRIRDLVDPEWKVTVKKRSEFTFKDVKYIVLDLNGEMIKIKSLVGGKEFIIPRATLEDIEILQGKNNLENESAAVEEGTPGAVSR